MRMPGAQVLPPHRGEVVLQVPERHSVPLLPEKSKHGPRLRKPGRGAGRGARRAILGQGCFQPFHRGHKAGDPGKVVGKQGKGLVQQGPFARGVVISEVRAEGRQSGPFEQGTFLQRLHDVVEPFMLLSHREVARVLRFFQQAGDLQLFRGQAARRRRQREPWPEPVEKSPARGDGQLTPQGERVEERGPVRRKKPHAGMFPAACPRLSAMRIW